MKRFKIFQIYVVNADDAASAVEKFSRTINPVALLDGQFVKEVEESGFKAAIKKQL